MEGDDEPTMAYFLPNGITDDSPPKRSVSSHVKASFGPIGGRGAASTSATSNTTTTATEDMDFGSALHQTSPFGASVSSPRNFLLSDLGGEIHTPRGQRGLGDASDATHTGGGSPFGFPGTFGSGLSEPQHGGGGIRSPSMFDRGQEAAKSFSIQRPQHLGGASDADFRSETRGRVTPSAAAASSTFSTDAAANASLYHGPSGATLSSYLNAGDQESPFGSAPIRAWASSSSEAPQQPRRMLQRPPGLSPPGLGNPSLDRLPTRMRLGSAGNSDLMQSSVPSGSLFGGFQQSGVSAMATSSASETAATFPSGDSQFGSSLQSQLSGLRLSSDAFGDAGSRDHAENRLVSNRDLAELNTQSVKVDEMEQLQVSHATDSPSSPWIATEPTTSRRIDVQSKSKTPRSPKKAREGRKRQSAARGDAKTRGLSSDAVGGQSPGSPLKPRRSDRGRNLVSSPSSHESSSSSVEYSRSGEGASASEQPTTRGKRRNQTPTSGKTASRSSATQNSSGKDNRRSTSSNQSEEVQPSGTRAPGSDSGDNMEKPSREPGRTRRGGEGKGAGRSGAVKKGSSKGTDKGVVSSRRQVYREKQSKDAARSATLKVESRPTLESPSTNSPLTKKSQTNNDGHKSDAKTKGSHKQKAPRDAPGAAFPEEEPEVTHLSVEATAPSKESTSKSSNDSSGTHPKLSSGSEEKTTAIQAITAAPGVRIGKDECTNSKPAESSAEEPKSVEFSVEEAVIVETASDASSGVLVEDESAVVGDGESQQEERLDAQDSELNVSSIQSSSSDAEKSQQSTDDQAVAPSKKSKRKTASPKSVVPSTESQVVRDVPKPPAVEKKHAGKEHRKEKSKKDKAEKKKAGKSKKDKRGSMSAPKPADALTDSVSALQAKDIEALQPTTSMLSRLGTQIYRGSSAAVSGGISALRDGRRGLTWLAGRLNVKGLTATTFSYVESVLAVVFSVVLLLSLHAASWFIRVHRVAFRAILTHRHIGFCFAFLYAFPFLVQYVFPWAPPWAPVCLWYAFLVQLFCTNGPTAMVTTFRIILPLVFLVEGISHHSFLLDLNGAELLLTSFIISALKTSNLCSPVFFLSLATQCLLAVFLGSELIVQWLQMALALYSLHVMAASEDDWIGLGEEEEDISCHPMSMHHSIADYNHHPAPSSAVSIQKTKRLDRRALAYVRGRKLR